MHTPLKPLALRPGDAIRAISPASPVEAARLHRGIAELKRLGYTVLQDSRVLAQDGYFAGSTEERLKELLSAVDEEASRAIFCARGGYGSTYLLDEMLGCVGSLRDQGPKIFVGYSDVTALQVFLWEKCGWVTFYGPMLAAGLDSGVDAVNGYDLPSLKHAVSEAENGWSLNLPGETVVSGDAEGVLIGGCLTLLTATLGTPWAVSTQDCILVLEDRAMKPWQVDRALTHLRQAGKLDNVQGIVFGDFPECEPAAGSATVRDVIERMTRNLGLPVVWHVPIGHTERPMLTLPLGVRAHLYADAAPRLEILEAACARR